MQTHIQNDYFYLKIKKYNIFIYFYLQTYFLSSVCVNKSSNYCGLLVWLRVGKEYIDKYNSIFKKWDIHSKHPGILTQWNVLITNISNFNHNYNILLVLIDLEIIGINRLLYVVLFVNVSIYSIMKLKFSKIALKVLN